MKQTFHRVVATRTNIFSGSAPGRITREEYGEDHNTSLSTAVIDNERCFSSLLVLGGYDGAW